ncbi:FosX/FosE/FosI family fosfomycin resistance thiol transferase [Listeria monocytogenes]|uniref:FosX/FosE/FosI family fosfomycin resistance thiol transferase n=1 Tax=Listeria monocytogenes TaxID=1639 RepID=A0A823J6C1_LISMN|nr:fosfomycin resistance hydrolase FosX [Listeria monocytogenes]EAD2801409.1 FosX/FosE/FosI family fosfomycin resistance thiol transferase [Listeria monocytogenes]EAD2801471.1 FosX/FosE/FosI family fosfomycin resistance thiol transferase [Listeria monocytogenes]EAD7603822.1 FosX/FosE/FosI family fosfomycin resistance thiol transferase [Listeria monocytogenes]EAD7603881.1 FosX/FosE/FosI family fosfomycin resistance thiol transferase [Listeria monocytogenes]EAE1303081.1 FosX/FosE/FosI family fos
MISGLSHITLIVKDLNKTSTFLREIFDAEEIYSSGNQTFSLSKEKFFLIAGLWICIMEGDSLQERTYNHIAFQIQAEEVDEYIERIKSLGVEIKPERSRVPGEGRSIYFYDFDNHLFELHAGTLEERLKRYHE